MATETMSTRCCIAGGGPAGMMLGLLLARAGIDVVVMEKHADFLRDFRGDTIHPSTLELMGELGMLDRFLTLPHQETRALAAQVGDATVTIADFSRLPTRCRFIAIMPQWDFLNFLVEQASRYPTFALRMRADVTGLIEELGPRGRRPRDDAGGPLDVKAALVVAADGRHSTLRQAAGLVFDEFGAPMDVLWFRISRRTTDQADTDGPLRSGPDLRHDQPRRALAMWLRDRQGLGFDRSAQDGLPAFREDVARLAPFLRDRVDELRQLGRRQAAHGARRPARASGIARACCASAMPRTRCRRSAASASTSRSRMPSRPPTRSPVRFGMGGSASITCARCRGGASSRRA